MRDLQKEAKERKGRRKEKKQPVYEEPRVITYSGDRLFKELGPAQACRAFGCPVSP